MASGFLRRYSEELASLRRRAARFAEANPKIAGRLRISEETADDPHVERLVQSFAYAAARVRTKLDDEFPELTGGMLEALYPHYLSPIPSMTIARLTPPSGLDAVQRLPRGAALAAEPAEGERCRFRSTQDVHLAPFRLDAATLGSQPIDAPPVPHLEPASCLRLSLRPLDPQKPFAKFGLASLRFFINAPWLDATTIHELVLNHTIGIALARHGDDPAARFLPRSSLQAVGFANDEGMLPYPPASFTGYRLLTEFFAMPQKFLFFDVAGLENWADERLEIFIYLDAARVPLERRIGADTFVLHATPVVNLFPQRAEPITVDGTRTEYPVVPDARRHATREVYSITGVTLSDGQDAVPAKRFFEHGASGAPAWQISRALDPLDATGEVSIAFATRPGDRPAAGELVAGVDTLSFNRDLPERLPFGGGHPRLELVDDAAGMAEIEAISPMTPVARIANDDERLWRLVSHLNLNHLSLADGTGAALRNLLRLYAVAGDRRETGLLIEAIVGLESTAATARLAGGAMVPGTDVTVIFEPARIEAGAAYLFASVLDHFFGLYTSLNSFTRLSARFRGRNEAIARWPARSGERPLL